MVDPTLRLIPEKSRGRVSHYKVGRWYRRQAKPYIPLGIAVLRDTAVPALFELVFAGDFFQRVQFFLKLCRLCGDNVCFLFRLANIYLMWCPSGLKAFGKLHSVLPSGGKENCLLPANPVHMVFLCFVWITPVGLRTSRFELLGDHCTSTRENGMAAFTIMQALLHWGDRKGRPIWILFELCGVSK